MKTKLALFAIVVIVGQAHAQDYAFKVLANKGKNELKTGDSWQQLKVGTTLKKEDEVRISENAYLGLVHYSGKAIEVRKAGKYKVLDLAKEVKESASVLNKYTDFILSSNTGPKNTLAATGAVDRGGSAIKVYLPKPELAIVYGDKVTINWEEDKSLAPYVVMFKSMFGDELASMETADNFLVVDLSNKNFMNEDNIIVTVESKPNKNKISDEYTLKRLSKADKERIKTEFAKINATTSEPTAINKMAIAAFFEQNNLLIDAIPYYQEAIKLAPDVPDYKDFYNDFLHRYGIKTKK
ncbi:MAG: hypothetical protein QM762_23750 [Chryseolinea sp.]